MWRCATQVPLGTGSAVRRGFSLPEYTRPSTPVRVHPAPTGQ